MQWERLQGGTSSRGRGNGIRGRYRAGGAVAHDGVRWVMGCAHDSHGSDDEEAVRSG